MIDADYRPALLRRNSRSTALSDTSTLLRGGSSAHRPLHDRLVATAGARLLPLEELEREGCDADVTRA
jgi:hypothetical protein